MAVLGEAWVVIRAIMDKLHGDVKQGLDDAAKEVETEGNAAGAKYGESFSKSAGDKLESDASKDLKGGIDKGFSDAEAEAEGKKKGESWLSGFKSIFSGSFLDIADRFKAAFPDSVAEDDGKKKGDSWAKGFAGGIAGGLAKVGPAITAALTPLLMVGGIAGLVGVAGGAIMDLVGGLTALIGPLSQVGSLLGVGMAAGFGALIQGATLGSMWLKDLTASAKNVPPAAAAARQEFQNFSKSFHEMVAQVGNQTVFPALHDLFKTLTADMPMLKTGITETGQAIAGTIGQFTTMMKEPFFQAQLGTVMSTNANTIKNIGTVLADLVKIFVNLIAAASPFINMFTSWLAGLANKLSALTEAGNATGKLTDYFAKAAEIAKTVGSIFSNLFGIIGQLAKAAEPLGEALLKGWDQGTASLDAYLHSAQGVKALGNFFDPNGQMAANLKSIGDLLMPLILDLGKLATQPGIQQFAEGIKEALPGVTNILIDAANAVGSLAKSLGDNLASPAGLAGIKVLGQGVKDLGSALQLLTPAIGPIFTIVGNLVSSFVNELRPALAGVAQAFTDMEGPATQIGNAIGNVVGGALKVIEQILPPVVAAVGQLFQAFSGPIGSVISGIGTALHLLWDVLSLLVPVVSALAPELTALAVAFVAMKAASALSSVFSGWSTALGDIGIKAAIAVEGLSGSEAAAMRTVGAFGGAESAVGGLAKGLGGLASALPFIGAAVAALIVPFANWISGLIAADNAAVTFKVNTDGMTQALQASNGVINQSVTQAAALAAQRSGLLTQASQMGLSEGTVTQAMLGNKDAMTQAIASAKAYGDQLALTGQGPMSDAVEKNNNFIKALEGAARSTDGVISAQQQVASAVSQANGGLQDNQTRLQGVATDAGQAGTQVSLLVSDLAQLSGGTISVATANANMTTALANAKTQFDGMHNSALTANDVLQATSPAAAAVSTTMSGLAKAFQQNIASMEGNNATTAETVAKSDALRAQMVTTAQAAGLNAQEAQALTDALLGTPSEVNTKIAVDTANADAGIDGTGKKLADLGSQSATPTVKVDPTEAQSTFQTLATNINGLTAMTAVPKASMDPGAFNSAYGNVMGNIATLGGQNPTPFASLNIQDLTGSYTQALGDVNTLGAQRPNPLASLNIGPLESTNAAALSALSNLAGQHPTPTVNVIDRATSIINSVALGLASLHDKTLVLTTVTTTKVGAAATGGEVDDDQWTTVGEHGRELLFLSKGTYVATYQQAQTILAAANIETQRRARALASMNLSGDSNRAALITSNAQQTASTALSAPISVDTSSAGQTGPGPSINMPIAVYPSAGMDERTLAQQVGNEVAYQLRRV